MANSMATLSRRLCRSLLSSPKISQFSMPFCTNNLSSSESSDSDDSPHNLDIDSLLDSVAESSSPPPPPPSSSVPETPPATNHMQTIRDASLQDGLDVGIYKAILVGKVGQMPVQKHLKNGGRVTMLMVGTGGIRNNRRPLENEEPKEYANRCAVQWHRVSIYPTWLADVVAKNVLPG